MNSLASVALPIAAGLLIACVTGRLLHELLYHGFAQTFDTMLYARALWGVAHGDYNNPTVGVNSFSVHAHWGLLALAPLVRWFDATTVLIGAQAAAAGATTAAVGLVSARCAARAGLDAWSTAAVGAVTPVLAIGAALVGNAFLFDARPDLLAVPLATVALLRVHVRGDFDRLSSACLLGAVLMREEVAMLAAPAFLIAPATAPHHGRTLRWFGALSALAYWAAYWLILRKLLGGAEAIERLDGTANLFLGGQLSAWVAGAVNTIGWKAEILAAAASTLGGFALFGSWRWWVIAAPGLAFVVLPNRMPELALNFHYGLFAAPALLAAGVSGLERVARWIVARRSVKVARTTVGLAAAVVAVGSFAVSSAYPGGGRFRTEWFRPADESAARVAAAHAVLERLPADATLAISYVWGAPYCDRAHVESDVMLRSRLLRGLDPETAPEFVALRPDEAARSRAELVDRLGYTEQIEAAGALILFVRGQNP